jgi:hypothetical protein
MQCILGDPGCELLREIHASTCGHHAGPRTLVRKAFRLGFYWPTAVADSKDIVRETTRISANGIPNLSTSVVVPGGLPRAIPVSAMPKSIQKDKNSKVEYNIYFIT